ncbi:MAG: hypothetical protein HQM01_03815 [Magnetococcales bacterium]|nr:hypothetical protein [Magnetococcales bacterium]
MEASKNDQILDFKIITAIYDHRFSVKKPEQMIVNPTTFYDNKKYQHPKPNSEVPMAVLPWIKRIRDSMKFRTATPKNCKWFQNTYRFPNEKFSDACYLPEFASADKCSKCSHGIFSPVIYPNLSAGCIDKLIQDVTNKARNEINVTNSASRYLLTGRAGEGKTSFINYLFSTKQELFWKNKLIYAKINLSSPLLLSEYQAYLNMDNNVGNILRLQSLEGWINFKVYQMIKKWYLSGYTSIVVNRDCYSFLSNEKDVYCATRYSTEGERTCFLIYKNYSMTTQRLNELKDIANSQIGLSNIDLTKIISEFEKLYTQSQSTLPQHKINEINNAILSCIKSSKNSNKDELINILLSTEVKKEYLLSIPGSIMKAIVDILKNENFSFFIVLDGLDPTQKNDISETVTLQLYKDILSLYYLSSVRLKVPGSYLLAIRQETYERVQSVYKFPSAPNATVQE